MSKARLHDLKREFEAAIDAAILGGVTRKVPSS
jgi:hypothetical protein